MMPFTYAQPRSVDSALVEPDGNTQFIAGGTSLLDLMKLHVETPARLIDINRLPLNQVEPQGDRVHIGALVRNSDLAYHPLVRERYPVLAEALIAGASPQLRNMATVGGNLLQRTRCPYFRDTVFPCNKRDPGTGCSAIEGYNRMHAILGASDYCIAVMPSDMAVALVALETVVHTRGTNGERRIPITQFYVLPDKHPERENVLEPGELVTAVELPALPFARRSHYLKVRDRASYAFALVSVAAALDIQNGNIRAARLALGGVATQPRRAFEAEAALVGQRAEESSYRRAAEIALRDAKPLKDNAFKVEMAKRAIVSTLNAVGGMS